MVQLIKYGALGGGEKYNINVMWIDGLADDTKPTDKIDGMSIPNGSIYTEVDTGKTYMFDRENATWYEVSIGGGGGTSGGIVLVGTTTTQLTDGATTNPITVDGQSYTAQPNDAVIYGNKEFLFDGTNWHEFGDLSGLSSNDIGSMTGYEKPNATSAISTSDTLNQAVGKLEKALDGKQATIDANNKLSSDLVDDTNNTHKFATQAQLDQIGTNQTNILLIEQMNGKKNCFDYNSWKTVDVYNGTKTNITNGVTITATDNNCFTRYEVTGTDIFPVAAQMPVTAGKKYIFMWDYTAGNSQTNDTVLLFGNGDLSKNVAAYSQAEKIEYTVPNDVTFVTFRLGVATSGNSATYKDIMFVDKTVYDAGFTDYQPYTMSNSELTAAIQAIQTQLANT